ncbi:hypothetical protein ACW5R3_00605 [Bizionia sp. KMM 8389]
MRFLIISCLLVMVSCASYPKKQQLELQKSLTDNISNSYFSNLHQDYVYKASIDVYDNHFGGLLIIKKMDTFKHRVVFTTEMGAKLFDFTFEKDAFHVNFIREQLNKKLLINILKKDFKVLITEHINTQNKYIDNNTHVYETSIYKKKHYYSFENNQLTEIIKTKNGKENVQFLFSEINNHIAKKIEIKHNSIKLNIQLKSITP